MTLGCQVSCLCQLVWGSPWLRAVSSLTWGCPRLAVHSNSRWPHRRCGCPFGSCCPVGSAPSPPGGPSRAAPPIHIWGEEIIVNRHPWWWGPACLLALPRGPVPPLFPSSETRIGMKGSDQALYPPTLRVPPWCQALRARCLGCILAVLLTGSSALGLSRRGLCTQVGEKFPDS